jgi:hypothetical protein
MPTAMPRAITLLSVTTDPATRNVALLVKAEDQSSYEIPIHPGIVGVIATALLSHRSAIGRDDPDARGTVMQPMQLNAVRGGIRPDGLLVLGLIL